MVPEQCSLLVLHCTHNGDYMAAVGIVVYACVLLFKSGGRSWQELCYEQQTSVFVYVCGANEYTYTRPCE